MARQAISVTLEADNLRWLKQRVGPAGARSVSDLLNQIVADARREGRVGPPRSVVGTVAIDEADPDLDTADAAIRELFDKSIGRAFAVRERPSKYASRSTSSRRGRA